MNPCPKTTRVELKGAAWKNQKEKVWCRDNFDCQLCGYSVAVPEAHHTIFKSQGGDDSMENLITLCFDCHIKGIHGGGKDADKLRRMAEKRMEEINHEGG